MSHARNKLGWCLRKAEKEGARHRGIKIVSPSLEAANEHIEKAFHNLRVMPYLLDGSYPDWAVSAGFYAIYHSLLALLAKQGYESRNQECTFAAVEVLIHEKKTSLTPEQVRKVFAFDNDFQDALSLRETFQYGTGVRLDLGVVKILKEDAQDILETAKRDLKS